MEFDEYAASEPDGATEQPMSDEDIVDLVRTENDTQEDEEEEEEDSCDESPTAIKNCSQFLAMLDQQKAFLKRNGMAIDIVEQLEAQITANQASLCSTQKNIKDYFRVNNRVDNFKTVADATKNVSLVDSLDFDEEDIDIQSVDTTVASVAVSALMRNEITPGRTSTPKRQRPSMSTSSEQPQKRYKLSQAIDKVMNMTSTTCTSLDSDSESLFSQD